MWTRSISDMLALATWSRLVNSKVFDAHSVAILIQLERFLLAKKQYYTRDVIDNGSHGWPPARNMLRNIGTAVFVLTIWIHGRRDILHSELAKSRFVGYCTVHASAQPSHINAGVHGQREQVQHDGGQDFLRSPKITYSTYSDYVLLREEVLQKLGRNPGKKSEAQG